MSFSLEIADPIEVTRQMAMVALWGRMTGNLEMIEYNRSAPENHRITLYAASEKAHAWTIIKTVFDSIKQLEEVEDYDREKISGLFPLLSPQSYQAMVQMAGEDNPANLDISSGHPDCISNHLTDGLRIWNTVKKMLLNEDGAGSSQTTSHEWWCNLGSDFALMMESLFWRIDGDSQEHDIEWRKNNRTFGIRALKCVVEGAIEDDNAAGAWDLNNLALPNRQFVMILVSKALEALIKSSSDFYRFTQATAENIEELKDLYLTYGRATLRATHLASFQPQDVSQLIFALLDIFEDGFGEEMFPLLCAE